MVRPLTSSLTTGESTDNVLHKLGGSRALRPFHLMVDAHLTDKGRKYAKTLTRFIDCITPCVGSNLLDQRQEFRRAEIERFYEEKFAQPSLRMADSPGPGTPIGKQPHSLNLMLDDLLPEKSFSVILCFVDLTLGVDKHGKPNARNCRM